MARPKRRQGPRERDRVDIEPDTHPLDAQTLELREEELVPRKEPRESVVELRVAVEQVPGRLELDAYREEVIVEHVHVGQVVSEREEPREEGDALVIPIYEEQLVVTKRLVLRERMRIRRVATTERQLFEDTLRRERLVVNDPQRTGKIQEQYPIVESGDAVTEQADDDRDADRTDSGRVNQLVRKTTD
jgi:uncharacterized protein (TIGR02271 family)